MRRDNAGLAAEKAIAGMEARANNVTPFLVRDDVEDADFKDTASQAKHEREPGPEGDETFYKRTDEQNAQDDHNARTNDKTRKQADKLVDTAKALGCELYHDIDENAYVDVDIDAHRETYDLKGPKFRKWLQHTYFKATHSAPNPDALKQAISVLEGLALFDGETRAVYMRIANVDGAIFLDLCNPAHEVVRVTARGWEIITNPPVRFKRKRSMREIVRPVTGADAGTVGGLSKHLNCDSKAFTLLVGWLLSCLRGIGPYPVLALTGVGGAGKTMCARFLQLLVDPRAGTVRAMPKDNRDLYVAATNGHALVFDNLSGISHEISDSLCRLSTGGGFSTRTLFTNEEEHIFEGQRPVALTSINDIATRADLADRTLLIDLESISKRKRKQETKMFEAFDADRAAILGALLDIVVKGLKNLDCTELEEKPRMADFAVWAVACENGDWNDGDFLSVYNRNREDALDAVIEDDAVCTVLLSYLNANRMHYVGTMGTLLELLTERAPLEVKRGKFWPPSARALSGRLKRLDGPLKQRGLVMRHFKSSDKKRERMLEIKEENCAK